MSNRQKRKHILFIFIKYTFINTIIITLGLMIGLLIYYLYTNKTYDKMFDSKITITDVYVTSIEGKEQYITIFNYNGNTISTIGQRTYEYAKSRKGKKVLATIIETCYVKNDKPSQYQILKIYEKYKKV